MELNPAWYEAIAVRRSRRRFSDRPVADAALAALNDLCERFRLSPGARAVLSPDPGDVFTGLTAALGAAGSVQGAPWVAAFVAPDGAELEAGYVGEAFILEATRLGLDTCWVAGMFRPEAVARVAPLEPGESVVAVTPVGHALERKRLTEKLMSRAVRAAARRQVEEIAPGLTRGEGPAGAAWPAWAIAAVEAARLAPSGANRQPWRFRLEGGALVLASADRAYWTAPIDFGIAMLHVELGAAHEGVGGAWEHLPAPDVARFAPD